MDNESEHTLRRR